MNPYDEIDTPTDQHADCQAVGRALGLSVSSTEGSPVVPHALAKAAEQAVRPAPSIHFDDYPREIPKTDIPVSEAAQRLANALHLHLD
ncbi:hypothetical protein KUV85_03145 [Nocardioides panacisoli]|uniref:hypothetical protein n=1 Tax=Nocardioides panacisoli TaxID=627624 RepID=UPI001C62FC25|nr:hypothetical protein [Nocardioides panacisoli]QYJ04692.1 hypothetical protein KUV85_03145 [Nocardioides panacisoli]